VAWFIGQSLVMIAAAFLLGLLVGWLIWGALWRRNRLDESAAVAAERERHGAELADRDAEIVRLREAVATASVSAAPALATAPAASASEMTASEANGQQAMPAEAEPASQEPAQQPVAKQKAAKQPAKRKAPKEEAAAEPVQEPAVDAAPVAVAPVPGMDAESADRPDAPRMDAETADQADAPQADTGISGVHEPADAAQTDAVAQADPAAPVADASEERAAAVPVAAEPEQPDVSGEQAIAVPVAAAPKKQRADAAAERPVDDLERIEGIGPKMAGALAQAGIRTYAELAAADQEKLREAIKARGLRFAPSLVTWSRQAQLLADGDEEGFEQLTRSLIAGREESRS